MILYLRFRKILWFFHGKDKGICYNYYKYGDFEGKENYSKMNEKVKVTDTEQTDKKVNEDTTLKEKLVEAECMEADMPEQSEEQDGTGTEETTSYLPLAADQLDLAKQYKQMMLFYEAGIRQLTTKLQILNREFEQSNDRNPIENIKSRIKSAESIAKKMERKGLPMTLSCLTNNIYDIAGIRVICPFITDVYEVARMLLSQTDVELVQVKDYIREPKENGYRSLHLIVKINVFFSDGMRQVPVEVQMRTIAMNFWATVEHSLQYKYKGDIPQHVTDKLLVASDAIDVLDHEMSTVRDEIMDAQNSFRKKSNLVSEILHTMQNLYKVANRHEVLKIQDEFYKIYETGDMERLEHFNKQLDIIAEGYRAQSIS